MTSNSLQPSSDFLNGKTFQIEYRYFTEDQCLELEANLGRILRSISLEYLHEITFTIINELLVNAFKANAKRIHFQKLSLDITDSQAYAVGVNSFKEAFGSFRDDIIQALVASPHRIQLEITNGEAELHFSVTNTVKLLPEERQRIEFRIHSSKNFKNLNEAYMTMMDSEESSGLGIVLVHLLLRNTGVGESSFQIVEHPNATQVKFSLPKQILPTDIRHKIQAIFISEVKGVPPLPDSLSKLIQLTKNPHASLGQIATEIAKNPAITADVIRMANTAVFNHTGHIETILEATKRIGIGNLETILLAAGSRRILKVRYPRITEIWEHSLKVSFFARTLCVDFSRLSHASICAVGGLLHDLGRMVLLGVDEELTQTIHSFREDRSMNNSDFIEEITVGTGHAEIGSLMAKKWNFPASLVAMIEYHHRPWLSPEQYRQDCEMVYMANNLSNPHGQKVHYHVIEPDILAKFRISNEDDFYAYGLQLEEKYKEWNKNSHSENET